MAAKGPAYAVFVHADAEKRAKLLYDLLSIYPMPAHSDYAIVSYTTSAGQFAAQGRVYVLEEAAQWLYAQKESTLPNPDKWLIIRGSEIPFDAHRLGDSAS